MLGIKTKSALIEFSTVIRILGKYSRSIRTIKVPQIPNRYIYFENKSLNVYFLSICYLLLQWTKAWPRPRLISKSFIPMNRPQFLSIFGCFDQNYQFLAMSKWNFAIFETFLIEIHLFHIVQGGFVTFSCLHKDSSCLCVFKNGQKSPKIPESNSRTLKNVTRS